MADRLRPELEALADEWIRDAVNGAPPNGSEAWIRSSLLAESDPEAAWELTLALIDRVPDHKLDLVAAVILEHILEHHAPTFVERVEGRAARDPRFRECLATVWLVDDDASPDVLARLNSATGNRLRFAKRAELEQIEKDWESRAGGA